MRCWDLVCLAGAICLWALSARAETRYEYDTRQRLTRVTYDSGAAIEYTYDASGNRVSRTYLAIRGDLDGDRDVDGDDFDLFARALAGQGVTTPPPGCEARYFARADLDHDGDVDLADFAAFQAAFTGAGG